MGNVIVSLFHHVDPRSRFFLSTKQADFNSDPHQTPEETRPEHVGELPLTPNFVYTQESPSGCKSDGLKQCKFDSLKRKFLINFC